MQLQQHWHKKSEKNKLKKPEKWCQNGRDLELKLKHQRWWMKHREAQVNQIRHSLRVSGNDYTAIWVRFPSSISKFRVLQRFQIKHTTFNSFNLLWYESIYIYLSMAFCFFSYPTFLITLTRNNQGRKLTSYYKNRMNDSWRVLIGCTRIYCFITSFFPPWREISSSTV